MMWPSVSSTGRAVVPCVLDKSSGERVDHAEVDCPAKPLLLEQNLKSLREGTDRNVADDWILAAGHSALRQGQPRLAEEAPFVLRGGSFARLNGETKWRQNDRTSSSPGTSVGTSGSAGSRPRDTRERESGPHVVPLLHTRRSDVAGTSFDFLVLAAAGDTLRMLGTP